MGTFRAINHSHDIGDDFLPEKSNKASSEQFEISFENLNLDRLADILEKKEFAVSVMPSETKVIIERQSLEDEKTLLGRISVLEGQLKTLESVFSILSQLKDPVLAPRISIQNLPMNLPRIFIWMFGLMLTMEGLLLCFLSFKQ